MRFFRFTRMAHILSLIVLMVAAMPFVGPEAGSPQEDWSHVAAMDVRDCDAHLVSDDTIPGCPGMMVHCVTFSNAGRARLSWVSHGRRRRLEAGSVFAPSASLNALRFSSLHLTAQVSGLVQIRNGVNV